MLCSYLVINLPPGWSESTCFIDQLVPRQPRTVLKPFSHRISDIKYIVNSDSQIFDLFLSIGVQVDKIVPIREQSVVLVRLGSYRKTHVVNIIIERFFILIAHSSWPVALSNVLRHTFHMWLQTSPDYIHLWSHLGTISSTTRLVTNSFYNSKIIFSSWNKPLMVRWVGPTHFAVVVYTSRFLFFFAGICWNK